MKVVHILNEIRHSGAETMLASAADILMGEGPATIISTGAEVGSYASVLAGRGYKIVHIPYSKSPVFWLRIVKTLKAEGADVVHIHTERVSLYYSAAAAIMGLGCVRTVHNDFPFEGVLRLRRKIWRQLALALGTIQVSVSSRVARNEKVRFGNETLLVENWYDPARIQATTPECRKAARAQLGVSDDKFLVVSIANDAPPKNIDSIIAAVGLCCQDISIQLFHCGAYGERLRAAAVKVPEGRARLVGTVSDIGLYLVASDAFVAASFFEGAQIVLLEAAASGTVCVTTPVGCAEDFTGLKNIVFVDTSPESIADALRQVARTPLAKRLSDGLELADHTKLRFTPQVGGRRYLELYRQAFAHTRRQKAKAR